MGFSPHLNISDQDLERNIRNSFKFPQFQPGGASGAVVICAAGISLLSQIPLLKALYKVGVPICAIKGVADVLQQNGIIPAYCVSMDGKEDQTRFFSNPHPDTEYLISGQSHPSVFDALDGRKVAVWHGEGKSFLPSGTNFIPGGTTTSLRAISLMWARGHLVQHLVGFDCCVLGEKTHVYEPTRKHKVYEVRLGSLTFHATGQMIQQYEDFFTCFGRDRKIEFFIHGNGMLAAAWKRHNDPNSRPFGLSISVMTGGEDLSLAAVTEMALSKFSHNLSGDRQ